METNKIYNECCLKTMARMEDNSIDTIITDPPYGLRFMGRKWDYDVPRAEIWKECLRVLKPGGTALIFAGSRTQHRMAVNVEDAGFILKDCIMWIYGSGFPKATDISKQLDKGHEREIVGGYEWPDGNPRNTKAHKTKRNGIYADIKTNDELNDRSITSPATPEARLWNGWKSHGLKPAYEPILVCMKPNDGTYAENALKHGVAGLNIDGGRIPLDGDYKCGANGRPSLTDLGDNYNPEKANQHSDVGRFPANIILDEEAASMLDEQSGELTSGMLTGTEPSKTTNNVYGKFAKRSLRTAGDRGGASRFFYCAKASRSERNRGCGEMPLRDGAYGKNLSSSDKGIISGSKHPVRNNHPTVKPLKLMEYLCKLTRTPTGGIVYDPFIGSGTTALGCIKTSRDFIGSELLSQYCDIADRRIKQELAQGRLALPAGGYA